MSQEIVPHSTDTALTIRDGQTEFTPAQLAALVQLGVADAPEADRSIFFHQCKRTGLDPFLKQIYMIGRWSPNGTKYTIQMAIDGFRLIATRTGLHMGTDDAAFQYDNNGNIIKATVTVWRLVQGVRCAFTASAFYREYVQTSKNGTPNSVWSKSPHTMTAKCAEALALRKAFPQDLSGLYTTDEMGQPDNEQQTATIAGTAVPAPQQTHQMIAAGAVKNRAGQIVGGGEKLTTEQIQALTELWTAQGFGEQLTRDQADGFMAVVETLKAQMDAVPVDAEIVEQETAKPTDREYPPAKPYDPVALGFPVDGPPTVPATAVSTF